MIDLHTHTLLSDGKLLPSELVRYAVVKGYTAVGITDHVDMSNIDFVLSRTIKASKSLSRYWNIKVIPGVEITHVPLQEIGNLTRFARKNAARLIIAHGETVSEPVISGTNITAIECGVDILAHPGCLTEKAVKLATRKNVYIEITTRRNHLKPNRKIIDQCLRYGGKLILNTDSHDERDLITDKEAFGFLRRLKLKPAAILEILNNSKKLLRQKKI